jgi:multidrug resistance efflux pump
MAWRSGLALVFAGLAAVAAACARPPAIPTCRVEERDFRREIVAEGYLQAEHTTKVTAPTDVDDGLSLQWLVADGTPVATGEVVARFDETPWRRALDSAEGERAGVGLKEDRHRVGREVDGKRSELDVGVARAELAQAERFQAKDALVFSRNERVESELDADLARRREAHAIEVRGVQGEISQGEGRLIALEGEQARQNVVRAEKGLASLTAVAPSAGLAVLVRTWRGETPKPGDMVWPGQPIAEIPDLSSMQAEILVLEADAGGLAVGQSAKVRVEAHAAPDAGADVAAKVERVDKVAKPRIRNVPVQYFGATLSLAATDPKTMKPGQRVLARVEIVSLPKALVVPRTAVFQVDGKSVVYRRQADAFVPVEVEVTASANGLSALGKGVAAGDELALVDPRHGGGELGASSPAGKGAGG